MGHAQGLSRIPGVPKVPDVAPPTSPANLADPAATKTPVSLNWTMATDIRGVAGNTAYVGGTKVATTTSTRYMLSKLKCGRRYTPAIDAFDAARNHSARASTTVWTSGCWIGLPVATHTGLTRTEAATTSISVGWNAPAGATPAGYTLYRNGASVGTVNTPGDILPGLGCATTYTLAVDEFDAAAKHSTQTTVNAATAACAGSVPSAGNVFVSPTGSDSGAKCVRSAAATAFPADATTVCKSFDKAVTIALAGDTILAAGGSYAGQQINQHPKESAVSLYVVAGQTATISGSLSVATDHLDLYGPFVISGTVGVANSDQTAFLAHDVSINNFSAASGYIKASHVLLRDGTIGPYHACVAGGEDGLLVSALYPSWTPSSYVTLDNITVHDIDRWINPSVGAASGTCSVHTDGIQTFGADHLTIRDCHIYRTATSLIMSKPESGGEIEDNVTIENCMFGSTLEGGNGVLLGASGASCYGTNTFLIRNNTFTGQGLRLGCSGGRAIVRSNILPVGCAPVSTRTARTPTTSSRSGQPTRRASGLTRKGLQPPLLRPEPSGHRGLLTQPLDTCAKDAGDPANYPATDIFGSRGFSGRHLTRPQTNTDDPGRAYVRRSTIAV